MAKRADERAQAAQHVREMILSGSAHPGLVFNGELDFSGEQRLRRLPDNLTVKHLNLSQCSGLEALPKGLRAVRVTLGGAWNPGHLLDGLECYELNLAGSLVRCLPATLSVRYRIILEGCRALEELPEGLKVGALNLRNCTALAALPEGLETYFLDISGCMSLRAWPRRASVSVGRFAARGCDQLRELPPWLKSIAQLDLRDCTAISHVPGDLEVSSWIDVAGTGICSLPKSLDHVQIRWRGVSVDARIAFSPETIDAAQVLAEGNAEKRRVLLERMGYERFLEEAKAQTLDTDRDRGGPRRLLRVVIPGDEDLVCVSVVCPSTGRQYVIRVPPTMQTCRQAAAWVAGFDNPDDYAPLVET